MPGPANTFPTENKTETCIFRSTESTGDGQRSGQLKSRGAVRGLRLPPEGEWVYPYPFRSVLQELGLFSPCSVLILSPCQVGSEPPQRGRIRVTEVPQYYPRPRLEMCLPLQLKDMLQLTDQKYVYKLTIWPIA